MVNGSIQLALQVGVFCIVPDAQVALEVVDRGHGHGKPQPEQRVVAVLGAIMRRVSKRFG
ncbi:hypothetical protein D9M73_270760 [compost metagenome]